MQEIDHMREWNAYLMLCYETLERYLGVVRISEQGIFCLLEHGCEQRR